MIANPTLGVLHARIPEDCGSRCQTDPGAIPGDPAERHRIPGDRPAAAQQSTRNLCGYRLGRAAVRVGGQVRFPLRLAELHQADRARECGGAQRYDPWHGPHRSALEAWRQPSRPCLQRRAAGSRRPQVLHQLGVAALRPSRPDGSGGLRGLSQPGGGSAMSEERAVLAGGCFWGMQGLIRRYDGVISTRVGYTGGDVPNATYRNHGTHAEAIEILFDPAKITFRRLLEFFFQIHDPTTLNRQGNDRGTAYRSAIYYTSPEQKQVAEDTIADVNASGLWPGKVVTEVAPVGPFWEAEPEHQDYLERIPNGYTCHFPRAGWVLPKRSE